MNIRVDLNAPIRDGTEVVFRSPVDCSQITGLIVYYNGESKEFALADAHGNNVGDIDHLFAENVVVKVILDVTTGMAFVQNADTNAYLENRINGVDLTLPQDLTKEQKAQARDNIGAMQNGAANSNLDMSGYDIEWVRNVYMIARNSSHYIYIGCSGAVTDADDFSHAIFNMSDELSHDVVIRGVADGIGDKDAATVGQLNAAAGNIEATLTTQQKQISANTAGLEEQAKALETHGQAITDLTASKGFVRLAETVLTEDANEIMWTQGENGEKLSDYKDFFIHWVGKFDKEVGSEAWVCRANNGGLYFGYIFLKKVTTMQGFWWHIEELCSDDTYTTWKTTLPNAMLTQYKGDFDYDNQGLSGASQQLRGILTCRDSSSKIEHLRFGSLATGAKMVAGSKAVLYGRKR